MTSMLSEAERLAVACFIRGDEADLTAVADREIQASTIRKLMLGLPFEDFPEGIRLTGMGVRLRGAVISGHLNLEHGSGRDGADMPRLSLVDCEIPFGISLKSARLQRLCLKASRISHLEADHIHIRGLLDVRDLAPSYYSPECMLTLRGAVITDGIEAGGARLVAPPRDDNYRKYSERAKYALDLPEARIQGDIRLFPNFSADGGINLNGSIIEGSLLAHGARLRCGQLYALDASGAVIHGSMALASRVISPNEHLRARAEGRTLQGSVRFQCYGQLRLNNAEIHEDLRLYGAKIFGKEARINGQNMDVRGSVNMCAFDNARGESPESQSIRLRYPVAVHDFYCDGKIDLRGSDIGGDLNFRGAILGGERAITDDLLAGELDISCCRVGGHMLFSPVTHLEEAPNHADRDPRLIVRFCSGRSIKMDSAQVTGNLDMRGALMRGTLQAFGLKVDGYVNMSCHVPEATPPIRFKALDNIVLDSATVAQKIDLSGACILKEFLAPNLSVGGKLLMCAYAPQQREEFFWFEAHERVNLSGAKISSDFDLTGACLHRGMRFRGAQVKSALIIDIYSSFKEKAEDGQHVSLDLINASTNMLLDHHSWKARDGKNYVRLGYDGSFFLRLAGFSYTRLPHYADDESLAEEEKNRRRSLREHIRRELSKMKADLPGTKLNSDEKEKLKKLPKVTFALRSRWIKLQYRGTYTKGKRIPTSYNFNPDPYNTLYNYYKKMGNQVMADKSLFRKLKYERRTGDIWRRLLFWPVEKGWGYGLMPVRALATSLLFSLSVVLALIALTMHPPIATQFAQPHTCNLEDWAVAVLENAAVLIIPGKDAVDTACKILPGKIWYYELFKMVTSIIGAMVVTLTLVTWSGLLRRNLEP